MFYFFQPVDQHSIDSLEYQEGDTESDIETEKLGPSSRGGDLMCIKTKEVSVRQRIIFQLVNCNLSQ